MERTSRLRARVLLATLFMTLSGSGCLSVGNLAAPGPGNLRAHAWTMPTCPSQRAPEAGVLAGPAIGTAADLLLDRIASALNAAAAADRNGLAYTGTDADYLYFGQDAGEATPLAALAGCIVVAVAGDLASGSEPLTPAAQPALYAEIHLQPSRDGAAIRPRIVALHYPQPLQQRAGATRDLAFTLQLRLPEQAKGANLFVLLRNLEPGKAQFDATDLGSHAALWTVAPAYTGRKLAPADLGAGIGAINIYTEIRETGDTSAFLQALAASFADTRSGYAKALK